MVGLLAVLEPSLVKTNDVEVALKTYEANDTEALHHHKIADEYNNIEW